MSDEALSAINYFRKKERQDRRDMFIKDVLPLLELKYEVVSGGCGSFYLIDSKYKFYPKANSVYIISGKSWIKKYALNWIKKYLL